MNRPVTARWSSVVRVVEFGLRTETGAFVRGVILTLAASVLQLIPPLMLGALLSLVIARPKGAAGTVEGQIGTLLVWILLCVLGGGLAGYAASRSFSKASCGATAAIRACLHEKVLFMDLLERDRFDSGTLRQVISEDASTVSVFIETSIPHLVSNLALIVGGFVLVLAKAPLVSLVALVPGLLLAAGTFIVRRSMVPMFSAEAKHASEIATRLSEGLGAGRTVRVYGREERQQSLFTHAARGLGASLRASANFNAGYTAVLNVVSVGSAYLLYYTGAMLALQPQSRLSVGEVVGIVPLALYLFGPLSAVSATIATLWKTAASATRVSALLDVRTDDHRSPKEFLPSPGPIVMSDIYFGYRPGEMVLRGMTLRIDPGELVALVGENGAGKTTTINLLCRLYEPSSGSMTWSGIDARSVDARSWRRAIGVVMQETYLFRESVLENIRCGRKWITDEDVRRAAGLAAADAFVGALPEGYDTILGDGGRELSVGQKQRLGIARALAGDPRLFVLDEPTSALDAEAEEIFFDALTRIVRTRMAIVIAHRRSTIERADRVVHIENGRVSYPLDFSPSAVSKGSRYFA